mmetsp:Transcript_51733/g.168126  ORF Transcript_51733/g.168126 Transcript_51733/m.168126 type:complete len:137 (-) Transcript_51733:1405-1815(-)
MPWRCSGKETAAFGEIDRPFFSGLGMLGFGVVVAHAAEFGRCGLEKTLVLANYVPAMACFRPMLRCRSSGSHPQMVLLHRVAILAKGDSCVALDVLGSKTLCSQEDLEDIILCFLDLGFGSPVHIPPLARCCCTGA